MKAIKNAVIIMADHMIADGVLLYEDGLITEVGPARLVKIPEGAEVIDAGGEFVGPGLIDIHTHAGGGKKFEDDAEYVCRYMLEHGTTSIMSAMYFANNKQQYLDKLDAIDKAVAKGRCPNFIGYYMEGPYLNPKFGAERENNPWKAVVNPNDYMDIIKKAGKNARVWATAPERENILEFVKDVKRLIPEARFTVGHSEASPEQIEALIPYGLCIGTHHTNATGDLPKYPECRGVCVDETVNYHDDIYAELICDSRGIHVAPYMLRLVSKIKGKDKIILISDACVYFGAVPPGYEGVTDINFDDMGEIAGSKLTLNVACRNMMMHTGASLVDVFCYASRNPAAALGLTDRGEIKPGKRADLIITDCMMNVSRVILGGYDVNI